MIPSTHCCDEVGLIFLWKSSVGSDRAAPYAGRPQLYMNQLERFSCFIAWRRIGVWATSLSADRGLPIANSRANRVMHYIASIRTPCQTVPRLMPGRFYAFIAAAGLALGGCGLTPVHTVDAPSIPTPLIRKIPLTLGVHYASELRSSVAVIPEGTWLVGAPSIAAFDAALRGLFVDVVAIDKWPSIVEGSEVSGVLVPTLQNQRLTQWHVKTQLVYRIQLFSRTGEVLGDWSVSGVASRSQHDLALVQASSLLQDTLRSAAAALIASFFIDPQARSWLEANGVNPDAMR